MKQTRADVEDRKLELEMRLLARPELYVHYVHDRGFGDAGFGVWLWTLDTVAAQRVPGRASAELATAEWWRAAYEAHLLPSTALTQAVRNECAGGIHSAAEDFGETAPGAGDPDDH